MTVTTNGRSVVPCLWVDVYRKEEKKSLLEGILTSTLYVDDPVRFMSLRYVKDFVVESFSPFSLLDKDSTSQWVELVGSKDRENTSALVKKLGPKQVRARYVTSGA